ncbi:MAG: YhfZ family protein [Bacillota bacterium]
MFDTFYKKSGIVTEKLARDFFSMEVGTRLPTIAEYTQRFSTSRGTVQNALALLEENECITILKSGSKGTLLTGIDLLKLQKFTGWDSLTGSMPVPLNPLLSSLTTAICHEMSQCPIPFSFAFVTGSQRRIDALLKKVYDFIIVTKGSAQIFLENNPSLEAAFQLDDCQYSHEYYVYFMNPAFSTITDGMRVAVDPTSADQYLITQKLFRDKNIELVVAPYIGFHDLMTKRQVDCVIYRKDDWIQPYTYFRAVKLDLPGFSAHDVITPTILINKENYGLKKLLFKYLKKDRIAESQQKVLSGDMPVNFF